MAANPDERHQGTHEQIEREHHVAENQDHQSKQQFVFLHDVRISVGDSVGRDNAAQTQDSHGDAVVIQFEKLAFAEKRQSKHAEQPNTDLEKAANETIRVRKLLHQHHRQHQSENDEKQTISFVHVLPYEIPKVSFQ